MTNINDLFTPLWEDAPKDQTGLEAISEINLTTLPIGSRVNLEGYHWAAVYDIQIAEIDGTRKMKIWNRGGNQCLIGSSDALYSVKCDKGAPPNEQRGMLRVGAYSSFPYFSWGESGVLQKPYLNPHGDTIKTMLLKKPS